MQIIVMYFLKNYCIKFKCMCKALISNILTTKESYSGMWDKIRQQQWKQIHSVHVSQIFCETGQQM